MTRSTYFLVSIALVFGLIALARGQQYGPPFDCVYYYTCIQDVPCTAQMGTCGANTYNHYQKNGQKLGFCLLNNGDGCVYLNGTATCYQAIYYFDYPNGTPCGVYDVVCSIPLNNQSACEVYGE